jgi:hypothetical protein
MANKIVLYGMSDKRVGVSENQQKLAIEMQAIRLGGKFKVKGKEEGFGLPYHYARACALLWPWIDQHRWFDLCNEEIRRPNAKVTVLMGSGSTGKTNQAAWQYLLEYYCNPDTTLVLVSSTDMRGLELRVWGEVKKLHQGATEKFPELPGYLIDSKHCITTDELDEEQLDDFIKTRDLRKGVIGIPTVQGGKQVGLGKWCFRPGTKIQTPNGYKNIEEIKVGELVVNAIGTFPVTATVKNYADSIVRLTLDDGSEIETTPNHPFLTHRGWVNALDILPEHELISSHETMSIMRQANNNSQPSQILLDEMSDGVMAEELQGVRKEFCAVGTEGDFLFSELWREMEMETASICKKVHGEPRPRKGRQGYQQGDSRKSGRDGEAKEVCSKIWPNESWVEVQRSNIAGGNDYEGPFPSRKIQLSGANRKIESIRRGALLQAGFCVAPHSIGCRNRRLLSFARWSENKGRREGQVFERARVVRVEVFKRSGEQRPDEGAEGYLVHNLQVAGHPSYSVNGFIVHNCGIKQHHLRLIADDVPSMSFSFLSAFANLNNNRDFQALVLGNPDDVLDPLGVAAEPKDGWSQHLEPQKTAVWDTKFYNGRCVNLVGTDSPNFDLPGEPRFPYLVSQKKIDETVSGFGKDTFEYYSQCIGVMRISQMSRRVITRDLCAQFGAHDDCVWDAGSKITKLAALDAAYGGDRAKLMTAEFGRCVDGVNRIRCGLQTIVPVKVKTDTPMDVETQMSRYVKSYCEDNGVAPENFFHDSTGRGSLGTALAREWSSDCNPVEFGGMATKRPVSMDIFITDPATGQRRLKRCDEHYFKFVTEMWFSVRYAIEAGQMKRLSEESRDEFCARIWERVKDDRISLESKIDMKKRVGFSPDAADCVAIMVEGARRKGFVISKLGLKEGRADYKWLDEMARQRRQLIDSKRLSQ